MQNGPDGLRVAEAIRALKSATPPTIKAEPTNIHSADGRFENRQTIIQGKVVDRWYIADAPAIAPFWPTLNGAYEAVSENPIIPPQLGEQSPFIWWRTNRDITDEYYTEYSDDGEKPSGEGWEPLFDRPASPWKWIDGAPTHPYSTEWFLAETTFRDRVVLKALPEEFSYDFKTADDTYIMADKIKCWAQFPDSQFVAAVSPQGGEAKPIYMVSFVGLRGA